MDQQNRLMEYLDDEMSRYYRRISLLKDLKLAYLSDHTHMLVEHRMGRKFIVEIQRSGQLGGNVFYGGGFERYNIDGYSSNGPELINVIRVGSLEELEKYFRDEFWVEVN